MNIFIKLSSLLFLPLVLFFIEFSQGAEENHFSSNPAATSSGKLNTMSLTQGHTHAESYRFKDLQKGEGCTSFNFSLDKLGEIEQAEAYRFIKAYKPEIKPTLNTSQKKRLYQRKELKPRREKALIKRTPRWKQIPDMNVIDWPNCTLASLCMHFPEDTNTHGWGGTGVLVGPCHILTAGHNVFDDKDGYAREISAHFGLSNGKYRIKGCQSANVVRYYMTQQWLENQNSEFDIALLILDDCIGDKLGWCGLISYFTPELLLNNENVEIGITGYPVLGTNNDVMYSHATKGVLTLKERRINYSIDTEGGQSGSPIYLLYDHNNEEKMGSLIGIHTDEEAVANTGNSGVYLSNDLLELIHGWIKHSNASKVFTFSDSMGDIVAEVANMNMHDSNSPTDRREKQKQSLTASQIITKHYEDGCVYENTDKEKAEISFKNAILCSILYEKKAEQSSYTSFQTISASKSLINLINLYLKDKKYEDIFIWSLINKEYHHGSRTSSQPPSARGDEDPISILRKPNLMAKHLSCELLDLSWNAIKGKIPDQFLDDKNINKLKLSCVSLLFINNLIEENHTIMKLTLEGNCLFNGEALLFNDLSIPKFIKKCTGLKELNISNNGFDNDIEQEYNTLNKIMVSIMKRANKSKSITVICQHNSIKKEEKKELYDSMGDKKAFFVL